ncbi:MAG: DRTGG domain-containing protein [Vicinamibacterales bacterium]
MSDATPAHAAVPRRAGGAAGLTLAGLCAATGAEAIWCPDTAAPVAGVVAADLMSDVLVDARPGFVLVTGLVNVQVIRTAAIADLAAVVFARGKAVPPDVADLAREMRVPIFTIREALFSAAGRLYAALGLEPEEPGARRQG